MSRHRPLRIGLTGGIASGKSTVAAMFAELGVPVVDTDVIAREVVEPGMPALEEIRETFGSGVIAADGSLDRSAMRDVIFSNDGARSALEAIVHPRIRAETIAQSAAAGGEYQLIVVPLLVESPLRSFVDRIVVVDCDEETQVQRLLRRDAGSIEQARRMLAAQASREARLALADDVIENEGELDDTSRQVQQLHQNYLEAARAP